MKYFILLLIPHFIIAQITPPEITHESGFYSEEFSVEITHPDSELLILYTLDGSEPKIENLAGKSWNYKKDYPYSPGVPHGDLLSDEIWTFEYQNPISIYNRTQEETVLADVNTSIIHNNPYVEGELFKAFTLRVCAYDEDTGDYSNIITRNYFISEEGINRYTLPVVALSMDNDKMYSYETGINVPGILFDEWRDENPDVEEDMWADANYQLRGGETEIEINFNFFENGEEILNHNAGTRINGNYSRFHPSKSFRLYAKDGYGEKNFKHTFFENYPVNKFKRLILRNSGNDNKFSFFRDAFIHNLTRNLNFDIQESRAIVLFINGEYNGIRNLRERYDKKYFESIHGVDEDELDFLENFYVEVKEGDSDFFFTMLDFLKYNSLETQINYNQAITYFDPINFTDYYISNIFVANDDWPHNNVLFWRKKTDYTPNYQGTDDGRFRFLMKDADRGFYLRERYENSYEANTLDWATQIIDENANPFTAYQNRPTLLIRRLLENEAYKYYFITRFADLLNTTFLETRVVEKINHFQSIYASEIDENSRRWSDFTANYDQWINDVNRMKDFANNRPEHQRQHLIEKFNLDGEFELEVDISHSDHGYIHLNTLDLTSETDGVNEEVYPWKGIYFKNIPVKLTAHPIGNYQFSHWSGDVESLNPELTLYLNNDTYIKAHFTHTDADFVNNFLIYPNPTSDILNVVLGKMFTSPHYKIVDLSGKTLQEAILKNNKINVQFLEKGVYFIQIKEKSKSKTRAFIKK